MLPKKWDDTQLNELIDECIARMRNHRTPESEEYKALLSNLERFYELKKLHRSQHVTPDTLALVAANLIGICVIVAYEHSNIIASKAINFVIKPR